MVDVPEWPKWLNDIITKLDASSSEQGPSAVHGPAKISPTLRKALRDNCIELHELHLERKDLRAKVAELSKSDERREAMGGKCMDCGRKCGASDKCSACSVKDERIAIVVWLRSSKLAHEGLFNAEDLAGRILNCEHLKQ